MDNPIQNDAEMEELKYQKSFASTEVAETKEGISTSINDPDRMLSIIVLVLACLGLALLAHVVV